MIPLASTVISFFLSLQTRSSQRLHACNAIFVRFFSLRVFLMIVSDCLPLHMLGGQNQKSSPTHKIRERRKAREEREETRERDERGDGVLFAFYSDALSSRLSHFLNGTFSSLILSTLMHNFTKETHVLTPFPLFSLQLILIQSYCYPPQWVL